jgi:hypothetical protein
LALNIIVYFLLDVVIFIGILIVYKFDKDMQAIVPSGDLQTASQVHMNGLFLEKPGLLKEALAREEEWARQVPGYNSTLTRNKTPMTPLERSLYKLKAERELGEWAGQFIDPSKMLEDDGNDGNMQKMMDEIWAKGLDELAAGEQFDPDAPEFQAAVKDVLERDDYEYDFDDDEYDDNEATANIISNQPCIRSMPTASILPGFGKVPIRKESVIVMIRHGKTEHNKLGLFTGKF